MTIPSIGNFPPPTSIERPSVEYVVVDPITAAAWLESNVGNRNLSVARVTRYAHDMQHGLWTLSESLICFDVDGRLINGQHRLHAVIESGTSQTFAVQWNTPLSAQPNMDTGKARSASDALRWQGEAHAPVLAAAARLGLLWTSERIYKDTHAQSVSHAEIVEFLEEHPEIRASVLIADKYRRSDCAPSVLTTAHWGIANVNGYTIADKFVDQIGTLTNLTPGHPVLALNDRLRVIRQGRVKMARRETLALIIKVWNLAATGQTATRVEARSRSEQFRIAPIVRVDTY